MLMTTHDNPTDAGERLGMHDHDRPSGPETMR